MTRRIHILNAARAGDADLQRRGDKTLNGACTGAAERRCDIDDAALNFRKFAQIYPRQSGAAEQQQQAADHDGQYGTFYKVVGKGHLDLQLHCVINRDAGTAV